MKILVTGGAGFIGSALIRHIISNTDFTVINVDKLTYAGNLNSLLEISKNKRYFFEKVDICDKEKMSDVFKKYKPNAIMHLAAESHVDRSIENPYEFLNTNISGTYTLLECSREFYQTLNDSKKSKFIFHHVSTDEVYGDLGNTNAFFTEQTSYSPSSPYSASKASSDHLVRAWNRTYNLPTVITNCSNNYGPYHFPEKLIPHIILNAINGKKLPIYGDGNQIRDWLYVDDHIRALMLVATKAAPGESYNIGGNNEKKNLEVVEDICNILEELAPIKPDGVNAYKDLISFVDDRAGHDRRYAIDASKIHNELGWQPIESFESGLRKTVRWYLSNRSWYENVLSGEYIQNNVK